MINAFRFGFVMTYPKSAVGTHVNSNTGYIYEPWHWRYIGVQPATDFQACQAAGYTSEDFLRLRKLNPNFQCAKFERKH